MLDDIVKFEDALTRVQERKTMQLTLKHAIETTNKGGSGTEAAKAHAQDLEEVWKK